tara:strand:+ start:2992 stop:3717 length:726 start_codon:yes stop_codon:yes gene_type:complete
MKTIQMWCVGFCFLSVAFSACSQIPGFSLLETGNWKQTSCALEHWTAFDAFAANCAAPVGEQMHFRIDAVLVNSAVLFQSMWGHEIPWGEHERLVVFGGAKRESFPQESGALWSVLWRAESRIKQGENAWRPFVEWSSPLRASVIQAASKLRFGGMYLRDFERGDMRVSWQWLEPSWTLDLQVSYEVYDWFSVGFSGQWQPRIWGLNCRASIQGVEGRFGLAPVPMGGWRSRWICSKERER